MRRADWLVLLLPACEAGFDTPPATGGTPPVATTTPPPAPCEVCAEPFALAEVAFEVDAFEPRPAVPLPVEAKLEIGRQFGSVGQGPDAKSLAEHPATISFVGDIEVFDGKVAAPLRAAVKLPPRTFLSFDGPSAEGTFRGVVLRQPFMVTTADVVSATAFERTKTTIVLGPGPGHTDEDKAYAVKISITDAAWARVEAWWKTHATYPLAYVVHGRAVGSGGVTVANVRDFAVDLPWAAPSQRKTEAEKLAKEIQDRAGKH